MAKDPSKMTAEEIAAIRDKYSTKATMGEGKPRNPLKSLKKVVKKFMKDTTKVKKNDIERRNKLKGK